MTKTHTKHTARYPTGSARATSAKLKPHALPKHKKGKGRSAPRVVNSQVSKPSPRPKSDAQNMRHNLSVGASQARSLLKADAQDNLAVFQNTSINESIESIMVPINGQLLASYLYGIIASPLTSSDDPNLVGTAVQVFVTIFSSFMDMEDSLANVSLPLPIIKLRKALAPRTIGQYNFAPDWSGVVQMSLAVVSTASSGQLDVIFGNDQTYPTGSPTNGFFGKAKQGTSMLGVQEHELSRYFGSFPSHFKCINMSDYVDDKTDASAFAFDVSGGANISGLSASGIVSFCGYGTDGVSRNYIRQNGTWGLEVPCKRPELASLRLGTPSIYPMSPATAAFSTNFVRVPRYNDRSQGLPSVLGWCSRRGGPVGNVYLKPVPATKLANTIAARLEKIMNWGNPASSWASNMTPNAVRLMIYGWLKSVQKNYSGAYFNTGLCVVSNSAGRTIAGPSYPEYHSCTQISTTCRIPEYVARLFGALAPSQGRDSLLIPWFSYYDPTTVPLSLTYGTETITWPTGTISEATIQYSNYIVIATKQKSYEPTAASFENFAMNGGIGGSCLDTTFIVGNANQLLSVCSRRPITDKLLYKYYAVAAAITYDQGEQGNVQFPSYAASRAINNKEYSQRYRIDLSGYDVLDNISTLFSYEGIVNNGATQNEEGNMSSDTTYTYSGNGVPPKPALQGAMGNMDAVAPMEVPPSVLKSVTALAARLIPRKGKYCGPGWTAGVETALKDPIINDGRYLVKPTDEEDAICKEHDEAYARDESLSQRAVADRVMVEKLNALSSKKGLSLYAHAAKLAIGLKAQLSSPSNTYI